MSKEDFDCPLGIRLWPSASPEERRRLGEGYTFSLLENSTDSYRFTATAGAERIGEIFRAFVPSLPEEAFLILEFYQEELEGDTDHPPVPTVYYSPYLPPSEILDALEPYLPRLVHDGFVGFGLANNRAGVELFYSEEKVLTCFASNHIRTMDLLARLGLKHKKEMLFSSDFGHDHLSLLCHPREELSPPFSEMTDPELDYAHFCAEITEMLEMYPVEESLSFFLSKGEQDEIEERLLSQPTFAEFAEDDFGSLLLDWNDFVRECEEAFEGDLWEYQQGLKLRDMIEYVVSGASEALAGKIREIVSEIDGRFQKSLTDHRKRIDPPGDIPAGGDHFWYQGVVRNQGAYLRRDLIRQGWYQP